MIAVIANRGQYNHRIYRTLKYLGADSKLYQNNISLRELDEDKITGIVIGGGPFLNESGNSKTIIESYHESVPLLGICLGHQLIADFFGGEVSQAEVGEYAEALINVDEEDQILKGMGPSFSAWVSHKDEVKTIPPEFSQLAHSDTCAIEAMRHNELSVFGVQFHPEVEHTPMGPLLFKNFLELCG